MVKGQQLFGPQQEANFAASLGTWMENHRYPGRAPSQCDCGEGQWKRWSNSQMQSLQTVGVRKAARREQISRLNWGPSPGPRKIGGQGPPSNA